MKGLKSCFTKILFIVCFLVFCSFVGVLSVGSSASALVIQDGSSVVLRSGTIHSPDLGSISGTISGSDLIFTLPAEIGTIDGLEFYFNTSSGLSANYIFSFNVRYEAHSAQSGYLQLDGVLGENMDILTTSCVNVDNNNVYDSNANLPVIQGSQTVTCSYIALSHGAYDHFTSRDGSRILYLYQQVAGSSKVIVTPGFLRHISFDGLTQSDRDFLESVIPEAQTVQQVEDGVKNALDDERSEVESESESSQTASESAQDSVDIATSSLFDVIRSFITALTNVSAGTCVVDLDAGHMDFGLVNLCQLSPPSGVTALLSVVAIFFFVPLAWSTVSQIISMFRSFTNG